MITIEWYKTANHGNFYDGIIYVYGIRISRVITLCGGWEIPKGERHTKTTTRFVEWLMAGNADPVDYPTSLLNYLFDTWKKNNPALYTEQRRKLIQYGVDMIERAEQKLLDYQTPRYDEFNPEVLLDLMAYTREDIKRWKDDLNELVNRHMKIEE